MYIYYNANPCKQIVGDCVIRAISKVADMSWEDVYINLAEEGLEQCDIINSNAVWDRFLRDIGFRKRVLPNTCPACYTVKMFCHEHPEGEYVLATGSHAIAAIDGDYYDIFDSGNETVAYFYEKEVF